MGLYTRRIFFHMGEGILSLMEAWVYSRTLNTTSSLLEVHNFSISYINQTYANNIIHHLAQSMLVSADKSTYQNLPGCGS